MSLVGLDRLLDASESFAGALEYALGEAEFAVADALRPALLAGLLRRRRERNSGGALLIVAATSREADALRAALASLLPDALTMEFPAWETLPHERLSPSAETVGRRAEVLRSLRE